MSVNNLVQIKKDLQQIVDMLLLNGTLTECPGLLHGKMGIAIFFFHYAKFTKNELFADYAMDVISGLLDQIHVNSPADYGRGLAGIGVGFDYLVQHGFLSTKEDICEDFYQRTEQVVKYEHWGNFSLYNGVIGYGRYWITRLRYQAPTIIAQECLTHIIGQIKENFALFSEIEYTDTCRFLLDLQEEVGFSDKCLELLNHNKRGWQLPDRKDLIEQQIPNWDMEKAPVSTGLLNGYAGEGMRRLTILDKTAISWINLL